jgi:hypothetical protein
MTQSAAYRRSSNDKLTTMEGILSQTPPVTLLEHHSIQHRLSSPHQDKETTPTKLWDRDP